MRKLKGVRRVAGTKGFPAPTATQWRDLVLYIARTQEMNNKDRLRVLSVIRSVRDYRSKDAEIQVEKLSAAGKKVIDDLLAELGFELDFSEPTRVTKPPKRGKPDLKLV
ncbi:hypothetical protein C4585_01835 [Candidatus Parcubacteria bacterium]|nr:MAG: hypothetical protein C4585_01835 [Candidatus Parcubacteria bacterium]